MNLYLESSAFVKLLMAEEDADRVASLFEAAERVVTSRITYVECRAALAAAERAGRVSRVGHLKAKRALEGRIAEVDAVEVSERVVLAAGDLAESFRLRGYDAVQLASALSVRSASLTFSTWDRALAAAAAGMGLTVAGLV